MKSSANIGANRTVKGSQSHLLTDDLSRLLKPPGYFPAAYIFSSYLTCNKVSPVAVFLDMVAVQLKRSTFSIRTTALPFASALQPDRFQLPAHDLQKRFKNLFCHKDSLPSTCSNFSYALATRSRYYAFKQPIDVFSVSTFALIS